MPSATHVTPPSLSPEATKPNALVSVALAARNGARFIRAQIESVLAQAHTALELVVVDDASTDETRSILEKIAAHDARVRVHFNEHNLGHNANFARALSLCRGDYVAPCDQDDVWEADKLHVLLDAIGDADLAYGDSEFTDERGQRTGRTLSATRRMYAGTDPLALVVTNSVSGHALLCRRDLVQRAQPFPEGVYYDWWLALVAAAGRGIRYVDRPVVRFRRHDRALTSLDRPGVATQPSLREYLEGRYRLLEAMSRLPGPRAGDIARLKASVRGALESRRWLPLARDVWRYRAPLGYVLGPRFAAVVWRRLMSHR